MKIVGTVAVVISVVFIVFLLGVLVVANIGGHPIGERTIVGHISSAGIAIATMPQKLGITMDDGTYLILNNKYAKVDMNVVYHIKVKETKYWWGVYSDIIESEPKFSE